MMISQSAIWCLEATVQRILRRPASPVEVTPRHERGTARPPVPVQKSEPELAANLVIDPMFDPERPRVAREPSLSAPLTAVERRARAAALRALALSRGRCFDAARSAFTDAATLDPTLDLTRTPAFWKLERAAHEAAIDAYEAAGRDRDAAVLRARVHTTYRPRAVRTHRDPVLQP